MKNDWKTCLGRQCWWRWSPRAPPAGQYRTQGATVGRETGSIPRRARCIWEEVLPRSPLVLAVWDGSDRGWRGESRAAVDEGAERVCNMLKTKCWKKLMPGSSSLYVHAYRRATKNRTDGGRWSKACQGLDVCLLGQQAPALGVTGEGQGAQTLQVQMALPAGWLEEVLVGNHLKKRSNIEMGTGVVKEASGSFFSKVSVYL